MWFAEPEKRIGGFFQADRRRNGGNTAVTLGLFVLDAHFQLHIIRLDFVRKAQIGKSVLMRAEDLRLLRETFQLFERIHHLTGRAFEQPAAAACEKGISAEQPVVVLVVIRNMASCMSGHVDDVEGKIEFRHDSGIAFAKRSGDMGNVFGARAEYRYLEVLQQCWYAPYMVSMVMCQ